MSNDAPIYECESKINHYTGHYVPYSFRRVCGFFNVPQIYCKGLWDGAYGLSSLSEKTRESNHLQMLLQRQHSLLSYSKTLIVCPAGVWTPRPSAQQTGALPTELTGHQRRGPFNFFLRGGGGCTQAKSVCKTALKSLFWVPSCVPGLEYETWLACSKTHCRFANQDEGKFKMHFR